MVRLLVTSVATAAAVACLAGTAAAQSPSTEATIATFDPESATAPITEVEGRGVKVGEGTLLHPILGVETGFVSNVFYDDTDPQPAGVLRLIGQIGAGSLTGVRLIPAEDAAGDGDIPTGSDFQYRADLRLSYDQMLSGNSTVNATSGLGVGAGLRGVVNARGSFSFGFDDNFNRLIRAANFETDANTNRDINNLGLSLIYHPRGRSIGGTLYYNNTIDVFERSEQDFANRIAHRIGIRPTWRWLPQTQFFVDVSQGYEAGLGDSTKVTSYPLVAQGGIATLFSEKTTLNIDLGYTRGFYAEGPSYSSVIAGVQAGYRYSPLGRVALTYNLLYQDSINANFFRDHVVRLWLQQAFVPFAAMIQPEIHFRRYEGITEVMGPPTRNDVIFSVVAGVQYNFRNSLSATLDYRFAAVTTDYRYMFGGDLDDPGFVRHQLLLGVHWAL